LEAGGESPTGSARDDTWAWLTTDFSGSRGIAGSGKKPTLLERPALRTIDAARAAGKCGAYHDRAPDALRSAADYRPEVMVRSATHRRTEFVQNHREQGVVIDGKGSRSLVDNNVAAIKYDALGT
jgi:hypothetical protein